MTAVPDQQIIKAISARQVSQGVENAADISYLTVRYAREYSGLEECIGLEFLVLVGCDVDHIPLLDRHPSLRQLSVRDSAVRGIDGVQFGRKLYQIELPRNFVEDVEPLLECAQLNSVDVTGNPLSDASYYEVLPKLERKGVRISAPTPQERDLMLRMRSIGLPFAYYHMGDSYRLSRPGLKLTDMPQADHIKINPEELDSLIESGRETLAGIFDRRDLIPTLENP
ncbi:hypothetical protein ACFVQ4_19970 [Streptomyces laurentii]|uniref:hypothetical protein n=1 Tax=Streptomyces laurentii TaxID=39478 RepID=UPI0036BF1FBB